MSITYCVEAFKIHERASAENYRLGFWEKFRGLFVFWEGDATSRIQFKQQDKESQYWVACKLQDPGFLRRRFFARTPVEIDGKIRDIWVNKSSLEKRFGNLEKITPNMVVISDDIQGPGFPSMAPIENPIREIDKIAKTDTETAEIDELSEFGPIEYAATFAGDITRDFRAILKARYPDKKDPLVEIDEKILLNNPLARALLVDIVKRLGKERIHLVPKVTTVLAEMGSSLLWYHFKEKLQRHSWLQQIKELYGLSPEEKVLIFFGNISKNAVITSTDEGDVQVQILQNVPSVSFQSGKSEPVMLKHRFHASATFTFKTTGEDTVELAFEEGSWPNYGFLLL